MTPRGTTIGQRIAADLEDLIAHRDREPDEAAAIMMAIVAHITALTNGLPSLTERASER